MRTFVKYAAAIALSGALAVAAATPSQARHGRNAALLGGLAAGAFIGAAAANANHGYYYGPDYYAPGYADRPAYWDYYDYAPGDAYPARVYDGPHYYYRGGRSPQCGGSPASPNYVPCNN